MVVRNVLSGVPCLVVEGYVMAIAVDARTYPSRGIDEPEKGKIIAAGELSTSTTISPSNTDAAAVSGRSENFAALIIGDFAVGSGWFNAEPMLYMAFGCLHLKGIRGYR